MLELQTAAAAAGLLAILAPVLTVIRLGSHSKGRSLSSGRGFRTWQGVVWMTTGFVAAGILLWRPVPLALPEGFSSLLYIIGGMVYFGGVGIYLWGLAELGSMFGVSSLGGADLYAGHRLVTRGPFAWVRHPMYLGVLCAALGGLLIFRTWAMLVFAPLSLVVIRRAQHEDALLEAEFSEQWQTYAQKTPGWLPRRLKIGRKEKV